VGFVLRFETTTISSSPTISVTFQNLLDSWMVATSATTASQLFDFVKIKKIVIRAMANAAYGGGIPFAAVTVGVEFTGLTSGVLGSGKNRQNSGLATTPVFLSVKPDRMAQAAQWQPSSAGTAFVIRCADFAGNMVAGSLIDVHVALKNSADISPAAIGTARAGMTTGNLYFGSLDGLALAATKARTTFLPAI